MFTLKRDLVSTSVRHSLTGQIDRAVRFNGLVKESAINEEARTVEVVFTTGQEGDRWHWDIGWYKESLEVSDRAIRKDRLDKGLSVIADHAEWRGIDNVFGITGEYRIENGELIGLVRFATDEESDKVWTKIKDGVLRHFSLGYIVHRYEVTLHESMPDHYRATDWEPTELSIVVTSFETTNGIRSANPDAKRPDEAELFPLDLTINGDENTMKRKLGKVVREPATIHGDAAGGAAPVVATEPQQQRAQEPAPAQAPAAVVTQPAAQQVSERALLPQYIETARAMGHDTEHAIDAYTRGVQLQDYKNTLLEAAVARSRAQTPGVVLQSDNRADHNEQQRGVIADAIMVRGGIIQATPETRKYAGASLLNIARHLIGADNFESPSKVAQRAFHSTSDFPLILENVMNKTLKQGYEETPRTFLDLGTRASVSDFRAKHTYQIGDAPNLLELGEHGEYKNGSISESKESYAIKTFARKIGFTRQMLINDDLSALTRVPRMFGAAGSRLESDLVWGLLLNWDFAKNTAADFKMSDSKHLFHADHANLLTGVSQSALSKTGLSNVRKLGRSMKTLDNNFMNVMFDTLVIPQSLETTADELLAGTILANVTGDVNPFTGKLSYRVEPRLEAVSATAWFAFTRMMHAFEYAYLDGDEGMYTEVNTNTDIDGMEIKVRKDFGVGFSEYRAAVKATGAA